VVVVYDDIEDEILHANVFDVLVFSSWWLGTTGG